MLKDKLEKISTEHKVEKETEEQRGEDECLGPIREEIKDLKKQIHALEVLRNSLVAKSGGEQEGIGMEEYASRTAKEMKTEEENIETAFSKHKEALAEKVGVTSKEELVSHPEFGEEEEIKAYKSAKKEVEDLELTDRQLKNYLTKLGIEFDGDKPDYHSLAEKVDGKIAEVAGVLSVKKLETPEGKEERNEEIREKVADYFKVETNFSNARKEGISFILREGGYHGIDFSCWTSPHDQNLPVLCHRGELSGSEANPSFVRSDGGRREWIENLQKELGPEKVEQLIKEGITKAVAESAKQFWEKSGMDELETLTKIAGDNTKYAYEFEKRFKDLKEKEKRAAERVKELEKDRDFLQFSGNLVRVTEDIFRPSASEVIYDRDSRLFIEQDLRKFPPEVNFKDSISNIGAREKHVNSLLEKIEGLKTKEEFDKFTEHEDNKGTGEFFRIKYRNTPGLFGKVEKSPKCAWPWRDREAGPRKEVTLEDARKEIRDFQNTLETFGPKLEEFMYERERPALKWSELKVAMEKKGILPENTYNLVETVTRECYNITKIPTVRKETLSSISHLDSSETVTIGTIGYGDGLYLRRDKISKEIEDLNNRIKEATEEKQEKENNLLAFMQNPKPKKGLFGGEKKVTEWEDGKTKLENERDATVAKEKALRKEKEELYYNKSDIKVEAISDLYRISSEEGVEKFLGASRMSIGEFKNKIAQILDLRAKKGDDFASVLPIAEEQKRLEEAHRARQLVRSIR